MFYDMTQCYLSMTPESPSRPRPPLFRRPDNSAANTVGIISVKTSINKQHYAPANVPAQCTLRTSAFVAARGDKMVMRPLDKLLVGCSNSTRSNVTDNVGVHKQQQCNSSRFHCFQFYVNHPAKQIYTVSQITSK